MNIRKFHVNDRVIYIGNETNLIYYPPKNTEGTIISVDDEEKRCDVEWDNNVDEGIHSCDYTDLKISTGCCYCKTTPEFFIDKKDLKLRINKNRLEIRKDDNLYSTMINYCIFCGRKIKR